MFNEIVLGTVIGLNVLTFAMNCVTKYLQKRTAKIYAEIAEIDRKTDATYCDILSHMDDCHGIREYEI